MLSVPDMMHGWELKPYRLRAEEEEYSQRITLQLNHCIEMNARYITSLENDTTSANRVMISSEEGDVCSDIEWQYTYPIPEIVTVFRWRRWETWHFTGYLGPNKLNIWRWDMESDEMCFLENGTFNRRQEYQYGAISARNFVRPVRTQISWGDVLQSDRNVLRPAEPG